MNGSSVSSEDANFFLYTFTVGWSGRVSPVAQGVACEHVAGDVCAPEHDACMSVSCAGCSAAVSVHCI